MNSLSILKPSVKIIKNQCIPNTRNMATLREIQLRLKSVSNIAKITKSMKMIASTKLNKAQKAMQMARVYGSSSQAILKHTQIKEPNASNTIVVCSSSDRGLCGGIHSSISKATKRYLKEKPETRIFIMGDKCKSQMMREYKKNIEYSFNQIGKLVPTYSDASAISQEILKSGMKFDCADIIFNEFRSVIAYEAKTIKVYSKEILSNSGGFTAYDLEDESLMENYFEFFLTNSIYWALVEGHAAEMAAKRTAMENATKNADEMISKLTMTYNRGRQAVITNELIDIITGASAL